MSVQPKPYYSFDDYLAAERECLDEKHEYVGGQVFAMTGASYHHNLITANVARSLGNQLRSRPCTALSSDMRLRIEAADVCTYPDILVLCDEPRFHDDRRDVITSATLIVEVLSRSTEGYDRGEKFAIYRSLPELAQYVLIAQDRQSIDVFTRQADGRWILEADAAPGAPARLDSIDCTLLPSDVYDKVSFDPPSEETTE